MTFTGEAQIYMYNLTMGAHWDPQTSRFRLFSGSWKWILRLWGSSRDRVTSPVFFPADKTSLEEDLPVLCFCDPSTGKAEAGGSGVLSQSRLHIRTLSQGEKQKLDQATSRDKAVLIFCRRSREAVSTNSPSLAQPPPTPKSPSPPVGSRTGAPVHCPWGEILCIRVQIPSLPSSG